MVVTQHSGAGKANQYFLRGFNLDHGTDFATLGRRHAGQPAHARPRPGLHRPQLPDPRAHLRGSTTSRARTTPTSATSAPPAAPTCTTTTHEGRHRARHRRRLRLRARAARGLAALGPGVVRPTASSTCTTTGRGTSPTTSARYNALPALHAAGRRGQARLDRRWPTTANGTRPTRSRSARVDEGLIGRYGTLDDSDGGKSSRYSFSVDYATPLAGGQFQTTAYWFKYELNLFSNFTYFLDDPVNGDQFEQADDRNVYGWTGELDEDRRRSSARRRATRSASSCGRTGSIRSACTRRAARSAVDDARGRRRRGQRRRLRAKRHAMERLVPLDPRAALRPLPLRRRQRSSPRTRATSTSGITSPKAFAGLRPVGQDRVLPQRRLRLPQQRRARRDDQGRSEDRRRRSTRRRRWCAARAPSSALRTEAIPNVQSSLALWYLKLDSELVFVGDAGTTEAGRPSKRYGVEWTTPLAADAVAVRRPRPRMESRALHRRRAGRQLHSRRAETRSSPPASRSTATGRGRARVPALHRLVPADRGQQRSLGFAARCSTRRSATRSRATRSCGSTCSTCSTRKTNDITYYYASRLPGEPPEGVDDIHFHPGEKRSFRLSLTYRLYISAGRSPISSLPSVAPTRKLAMPCGRECRMNRNLPARIRWEIDQ